MVGCKYGGSVEPERDDDRDGCIIDLGSGTLIFCSLVRPLKERLLPDELVLLSFETLVKGSDAVEVSRNTWSRAENVQERTTLSISCSGRAAA